MNLIWSRWNLIEIDWYKKVSRDYEELFTILHGNIHINILIQFQNSNLLLNAFPPKLLQFKLDLKMYLNILWHLLDGLGIDTISEYVLAWLWAFPHQLKSQKLAKVWHGLKFFSHNSSNLMLKFPQQNCWEARVDQTDQISSTKTIKLFRRCLK